MRFTVVGCGAIGSTIGAHLVRLGNKVQFIESDPERLATAAREGLHFTSGDATINTSIDIRTPEEAIGPLGTVLLAVKAQDTRAAAEWCVARMDPADFVVSLQNGLCELEIAKVVGASRTVGAFVNFSAEVLQPGHVHFVQPESFAIALGEIDGTESARVAELSDLLGSFAPVRPTTNIWGFLWAKLGYANMLFATGVTPEPMGDVIERYPALMVELACEIYDVATAEGVTLEAFDNVRPEIYYPREGRRSAEVDATIAMLVAHRRRNAMTRSGVWRDLAVRHVPTEVDSQLGLAVAIGSGWGLKLPLTQRLVEIVHSIERGKMALSMQNVEGLEAKRRELVRDPPDPQETVALEGDKTIAG